MKKSYLKTLLISLILLLQINSLFAEMSIKTVPTVFVTFRANTATVPDTLKANSVVQIRGESPFSWDVDTPVNMINVGGDYWEATVEMDSGSVVEYKFFTNPNLNDIIDINSPGWEANLDTGNRIIAIGNADTTLPIQYVNAWNPNFPPQFEAPFASDSDSITIWVRVNMHGNMDFDDANQYVGVRGSRSIINEDIGNLSWSSSVVLNQEIDNVNGNQINYDGTHFWSGAIRLPKTAVNGGDEIEYKFVILDAPSNDANVITWGADQNIILSIPEAKTDTTIHWMWWDNIELADSGIFDLPQYGENISLIGRWSGGNWYRKIFADSNFVYLTDQGLLNIINISDPTNPITEGQFHLDNSDYRVTGVVIVGNIAYLSIRNAPYGFMMVDVTNKSNPTMISSLIDVPGNARNLSVVGSTVYLAGSNSIDVVDVTNPAIPVLLGSQELSRNFNGRISLSGNYAYLTDYDGFSIIDISNPTNIEEVDYISTRIDGWSGDAMDVFIEDHILYVADDENGVRVFDITNPILPIPIGSFYGGNAFSVFKYGNYIYSGNLDGVSIAENTIPYYPIEAGKFDTGITMDKIFVSNGYLYGVSKTEGLYIFEFQPPVLTYPELWKVELNVTEGNQNKFLQFGVLPNADEFIKVLHGEVELPPLPVSDIFEARFKGTYLGNGTYTDIRSNQEEIIEWQVDLQRVSGDSVILDWSSLDSVDGYFTLMDMFDGKLGIYHDMKSSQQFSITDPNISQIKIVYSKDHLALWNMEYNEGWNLVSIGLEEQDNYLTSIFNTAKSAFSFENSYTQVFNLFPGNGYWVNFSNSMSESRLGQFIENSVLELPSGWSLIGGVSEPLFLNAVIQDPPSSIISLFEFNNGYSESTILNPGQGYWINLSQNAAITLALSVSKRSDNIIVKPELPDHKKLTLNFNSNSDQSELNIIVADVSNVDEFNRYFELPPLPPEGIFDVRFEEKKYLGLVSKVLNKNHDSQHFINISIPQTNDQLFLSWDRSKLEKGELILKDSYGGILFDEIDMSTQNRLDLSGMNLDQLLLEYRSNSPVVSDYLLMDNYPNPFNPVTIIEYHIKDRGRVKLSIFNILGQEVKTLINEEKSQGKYSVKWDATNNNGISVSGGFYMYRLEINGKYMIKKMLLLK